MHVRFNSPQYTPRFGGPAQTVGELQQRQADLVTLTQALLAKGINYSAAAGTSAYRSYFFQVEPHDVVKAELILASLPDSRYESRQVGRNAQFDIKDVLTYKGIPVQVVSDFNDLREIKDHA